MQDKKQTILSVIVLIIVAGLIWGFASFTTEPEIAVTGGDINATSTATTTGEVSNEPIDVFAKCISDKGFTLYGADWCPHCANERKAFGSAIKYINYVECTENVQLCIEKQINGYPTWIDGTGKKYEGALGLKGLSQISGCVLPN
jgi:hypothetical protein